MKRILLPFDGSAYAKAALRAVLRDGAETIERIELLNVQPTFYRHVSRWIPSRQRDAWRAARSEAALAPARALLDGSGIRWRAHAARGDVATAIHETAAWLACDEIVLGTARHTALGRWLARSVSARLLALTSVPVRIVPSAPGPRYERFALPLGLGLAALLLLD